MSGYKYEKGNKHWMSREWDGRAKDYTPIELLKACMEWIELIDNDPHIVKQYVGKDGDEKINEMQRPYVREKLFAHLFISRQTWHNYGSNKEAYRDYFDIYTYVENIIKGNNIEGAALGLYKDALIAKYESLAELTINKNENSNAGTLTVEHVHSGAPLANNESDVIQGK